MSYRIIPKSEKEHRYNSEEVAQAVSRFRKEGGLIRKLPDQVNPVNNTVLPTNPKNYSSYELVGWIMGE